MSTPSGAMPISIPVTLYKVVGHDLYGQPKWSAPIFEKCAVVRFESMRDNTTVRTDSSSSHGHASEIIQKNILLFVGTSRVAIGDRIELLGRKLRVKSVFPRHSLAGKLHHWQVEAESWV